MTLVSKDPIFLVHDYGRKGKCLLVFFVSLQRLYSCTSFWFAAAPQQPLTETLYLKDLAFCVGNLAPTKTLPKKYPINEKSAVENKHSGCIFDDIWRYLLLFYHVFVEHPLNFAIEKPYWTHIILESWICSCSGQETKGNSPTSKPDAPEDIFRDTYVTLLLHFIKIIPGFFRSQGPTCSTHLVDDMLFKKPYPSPFLANTHQKKTRISSGFRFVLRSNLPAVPPVL